ncbi:LLM class flavin-dependent oxidoreductase [Streptosporangium saharense]|uniref:LLM class flavin-dependent oxidoreductase n=1 Tax=Streptosporangium saharense TaxID=1706840 RepID=UPI0036BA7AEF
MTEPTRELHLNLFGNWYGNHRAAWRHPGVDPHQLWDIDFNIRTARTAERGLFDAVFFADGPNLGPVQPTSGQTKPEPITLLSVLGAVTTHLGLASTVSTTYSEPYNTARQIASLDLLTGGRAGWNAVTGSSAAAASNFGPASHPEHALRYERSEEFLQIVKALWESWEPGAVIADQGTGVFLDPGKVHRVPFRGRHFQIDAVFNVPRSPQGRPLIFHAGDSDFGRSQGARHADAIFTAQPTIEAAREFYRDFKRRVAEAGRNPAYAHVMPGYLAVVGSTEAEARAAFDELNRLIDIEGAIEEVARGDGLDVSGVDLDRPIPDSLWEHSIATSTFRSRVEALRTKAAEARLTARQVIEWDIAAHGHYVFVGTPEQVADDIELWFTTGAADGFNYKAPTFPDGLEIFVDHVVPLLQKKGVYRREYTATTLRGHYGLPYPN